MQTRLAVAMAVALLCGAAPATATAHIRSTTGYSKMRQQGATVHYVLGVEYQPLAFAAGLGEPGTPAERGQRLRDRRAAIEAYLATRLIVAAAWVKGAKHIQTNSSSYSIDHSPRGFRYVHMARDSFDNPFRMYGVQRSLSVTSPAPDARVAALDEIQVNAYHTSDELESVRLGALARHA
jgi:hypothetical protein